MGIFEKIFKKNATAAAARNVAALINEQGTFTTWSGDAYSNDIYRAGVDAISRNVAKLKGSHVINYEDHKTKEGNCRLNRLLQTQPNPYMNAYDFLYKMVTRLYLYNNSFALLERDDKGDVTGIYPITCSYVEFLADDRNNLYCRFTLESGAIVILPYSDLIHLRRNFNNNGLLGDDNSALMPAIELAHTENEGAINAIKAGASIRGILKYTQVIAPELLKEYKAAFMADYLAMSNDGGIVATDQQAEYTPIDSKPTIIDADQSKAIREKIYNYLGISESIVNSSYDENTFAAFYESVVEPIAVALGMEFTRKIFNDREQAFGNAIVFDSGRLQFTSNATKVNLIKELVPMGLLTVNQALEILNLPAVKDGDKRLQKLDFIDQSIAADYQLGKALGRLDNKEV